VGKIVAAAAILLVTVVGRAEERCPWLNAATAGGVLGGDVKAQVTRANPNSEDAGCIFELRRDGSFSRLTIDVTTMRAPRTEFAGWLAKCGSGATHLNAIGNDAVACGGADQAARWERVVGRVRDRAFVIEMKTNERSVTSDALREKIRGVAEQVAGILF